jgi:hypothetical protein
LRNAITTLQFIAAGKKYELIEKNHKKLNRGNSRRNNVIDDEFNGDEDHIVRSTSGR